MKQYGVIGHTSEKVIDRIMHAFGFSMDDVPIDPSFNPRRFLSDEAVIRYMTK
jgi:hypothetical protein